MIHGHQQLCSTGVLIFAVVVVVVVVVVLVTGVFQKVFCLQEEKAVFVVRYANNVQSVINLFKNIDTKNEVSFHSLLPLSSAEGLNKVRRF